LKPHRTYSRLHTGAMIAPLALACPWLVALVWVLVRYGTGLRDSVPPSMADEARRRLSVR